VTATPMADNEKHAVIILDNGKHLNVQSTIKEIEGAVEANKMVPFPVIKVIDESGREIWLNANHIAAFHEYVSGLPMVTLA
jgi:uncharacterized protein YlzI (FlbEa/FlbD family)